MQDIIVVEGIHDIEKIKSIYPNAMCIMTNGSEISNDTITMLKALSIDHRIIVFTDPDSPGERIRKIINANVPNTYDAYLRKKDCISHNKKKVGIEHAKKEVIIEALNNIYQNKENEPTISILDLYELGLNGSKESGILRNKISEYLNIGRPNSKTFLNRLNMLQISKKQLEEIICQVK